MDEEKTIKKITEVLEDLATTDEISEEASKPVAALATLIEEPLRTEESPSEKESAESADIEVYAAAEPKKKAKKKILLPKKTSTVLVLIELAMLVICVSVFLRSVSFNRNDSMVYTDPSLTDDISCSEGKLHVNDVYAEVPTEGNVSYNISYTWGSEDTDYPSVPRSVTASYVNDKGELLYDISLYRDSFTPNSKVEDGKTSDNWFDNWEEVDDEVSTHRPLDAAELHGFQIISNEDLKNEDSGSIYTSSSFYFAVQEEDGISVYILEGILYNSEFLEEYEAALSGSIQSITIKKQA